MRRNATIATGVLVFILTYMSAWVSMRQLIILGDSDTHVLALRKFGESLSMFSKTNGRYPDSLDELAQQLDPKESSDDSMTKYFLETLGDSLLYQKTETGFRLDIIGGDVGLDGNVDSEPEGKLRVSGSAGRFLFDGMFSRNLFCIAVGASACAAFACHYSGKPVDGQPRSRRGLLFTVVCTTIAAVVASLFLVLVHVGLSHH